MIFLKDRETDYGKIEHDEYLAVGYIHHTRTKARSSSNLV